MTVISLTEYNNRCYGVNFQNNGCIKVQNFKDMSDDEKIIFCVKPLEIILGQSHLCDMTLVSRALEKTVFDGKTILLEISEENDKHRYVHIGGDMVCSFLTNDNIFKSVSNMGNILNPYSIAVGQENIYFLSPQFKFIKRRKINDNELLKTIKNSVDPLDCHVSNSGKNLPKIYENKKFIQIMIGTVKLTISDKNMILYELKKKI